MKNIDEDIKRGSFQPAYLLYGEEAYLKRQYKQKLKQALSDSGDSMNFSSYEGKNINPGELIDLAETLPFFADYRLILMEHTGVFQKPCEELADYMKHVPETTVFVFVEDEVDKRGKMYKAVKSVGRVVEFARQKDALLVQWVLARLKREGKKITQPVMQLFLEKT